MTCLIHDRPLRCSRNRGAGSMTGPEGMAPILRWIKAGTFGEFLHYSGNIDSGQSARLDLTMTVNRTKQRARRDSRHIQPRLNRANRAGVGIRSIGDTNFAARSVLVRLATA